MSEIIKVGMADWKVCSGQDGLTTLGLGSCVGIAVRDPVTGVGGLAHIMLPCSTEIRNNENRFKFADTGITDMVDEMVRRGAVKSRLVAKLAGGAQMFDFGGKNNYAVSVGARNVIASKKKLDELNISLIAEDTGETYGRTVVFYPANGAFIIRAVGRPEKKI